jgi:hypothetical protein
LSGLLAAAALTGCLGQGDGSREDDYLREAVACIEGAVLPPAPRLNADSPTASRRPS